MSRTVTALFDTRADAEAAQGRLTQAGLSGARILDKSSAGYDETSYSTTEDRGIWGSDDDDTATSGNKHLPELDRHSYEEGVRRGGAVVVAQVEDDKVDAAIKALEGPNAVDLDERRKSWSTEGKTFGGSSNDTGGLTTDTTRSTGRVRTYGSDTTPSI